MVKRGPLTPDEQLKVLAQIWGGDDAEGGYVFLPWIPGNTKTKEDRKASWNEGRAYEWPQDREDILKHLHDHETDDLYFSVNTFLGPSRVAQNAAEELTLWADLDEVNPEEDIDASMMPSIAWESSPGRFQAVWLMRGAQIGASEMGGINHRLTAAIGADPSGYDTTQLLRVPGRPNFKPDYRDEEGEPAPGRLMWVRARRYSWEFFETLPQVYTFDMGGEEVEESALEGIDRHEVWGRVRLKCSHTVRQFMAMRARDVDSSEHDRSEVLWQIERDLADAGCSVLEIVAVVRSCPWNKYAGRRNELAQLRAEAIKAKSVTQKDAEEGSPLEAADMGIRPTSLVWFNDLVQESIPRPNWLVQNIWAKGSVGFISGEPKSYKSYIGLDLAVSVALGKPFLNDPQFNTSKPRRVLYLQEEDTLPLVMRRIEQIVEGKASDRHWHGQLEMLGDTPDNDATDAPGLYWEPAIPISTLSVTVRKGFLSSDAAWQSWLLEMVTENKIELVVIDTLGTTNGDVDIDKSVPLNMHILKPLKQISEAGDCAIAVVHHNRKPSGSGTTRAGQSMLGSTALHAWVESALYVKKDEVETGKPAKVFVERENKLAQDLKFRVTIPTMHDSLYSDVRQVWEPEIAIGWGETQDHEESREEFKPRNESKAGKKIADIIAGMGGNGKYVPHEDVANVLGQAAGHLKRQLDAAVKNNLIDGSEDEGWTTR